MVMSEDIVALVGFGCEAVLYGAYCMLFILSSMFLTWNRRTPKLNWPMVVANCLLFSLCTAHFAIEFNHYYLTLEQIGVVGFSAETKPLLGADTLISVTDFVGDMVLLYRCWVIWGKKLWIIALPFATALAGLVCIGVLEHLVIKIDATGSVPPTSVVPLTIAGYALPLCTNVITTGLILLRIRMTTVGLSMPSSSIVRAPATRNAVNIILESGILYLIIQVIFVVMVAIQHPAEGIVGVSAVQIYGIAPTLIIIRVGLGISSEHSVYSKSTLQLSFMKPSQRSHGSSTRIAINNETHTFTDSFTANESKAPKLEHDFIDVGQSV